MFLLRDLSNLWNQSRLNPLLPNRAAPHGVALFRGLYKLKTPASYGEGFQL